MRRAAGVARSISDGDRNRVAALTECADDGGRHADAPAAVGKHHAGKALAANGHGHHVACRRAARLPGNDLRLALLAGVQNVVTRDGVDRHNGSGGINREIGSGGRTVTRFIADVDREGVPAVSHRLYFTGRKRDGPGAVAAHGRRVIFTVQRDRHNLARFRIGFTANRQRLIMFSGVNDIVLRDRVHGERRRNGIDANRLTAAHDITRRVFAAHVDRPGAVAQCLRVCRRDLHAPCAMGAHFRGIGFAVQRDGQFRSLRQVFAGTRERKACRLLAGVDDVIARRCCQRYARLGSVNGHGDATCGGGFTAVDLYH